MLNYDYEKEPQGELSFFELKMDKRTKRFLEVIERLGKPRILEIGMGQGRFLKKIAGFRPDAELYGIDISKSAINAASCDSFLKGEFVVGDAQNVPFPQNFFDVVVIMDVVEHLDNPQKAILEIRRVLRPYGIFHFYVPCENQPFTLDWFLRKTNFLNFKDFTKIHFGHIQYFSQADIKELVSPYFSKIIITYSAHWISQIFHFLTLYLPKKFISFLGRDVQIKTRDASNQKIKGNTTLSPLVILKKLWLLFIFPVTLIYEIEAQILKNFSFSVQGLHFTGQKKYE